MFFDVIAPAQSPQLSAHTYTAIYGGSSGCSIKINNNDVLVSAGKTIYTNISSISGGNGCYLVGVVKDNPIFNDEPTSLPYEITFRTSGSAYRSTFTTTVDGFDRYYRRFMTITPELEISNPIAPATVSVYSYRTDLELVTSFNNGIASSNNVSSDTSNTINFNFYYGARQNGVLIAEVGDTLRVRIIDTNNNIIAETNFLETSSNFQEPQIVNTP